MCIVVWKVQEWEELGPNCFKYVRTASFFYFSPLFHIDPLSRVTLFTSSFPSFVPSFVPSHPCVINEISCFVFFFGRVDKGFCFVV